ncbi:MAG: hypothetical protein F6J87_31275 [Spirulina sp. SIO3F2]|nr:hypothetical protein [Spirulina sp. SIO3F2]
MTRIGDVLLQSGAITEEQLGVALDRQQAEGTLLGEILVEEGIISPATLVHTLGQHLGLRSCVLRHGLVDPELLKLISADVAQELGVMPMFKIRDEMTVAMAEPQSLPTIDRLTAITECRIRPVLALRANIDEFIDKYAQNQANLTAFLSQLQESDVEVFDSEKVDEEEGESDLAKIIAGSPIVNLVNMAVLTLYTLLIMLLSLRSYNCPGKRSTFASTSLRINNIPTRIPISTTNTAV